MANLNLGQDVANKSERIDQTAAHIVAKSNFLLQAVKMRRCSSLININPPASYYQIHESHIALTFQAFPATGFNSNSKYL